MYPHERSLVKRLTDKPFALIGVNSDKDLDELKTVLKDENISWRSFTNGPLGTGGPISQAWNVRGWPTMYLIDHKGVIRKRWVGAPTAEVLGREVERAVAAAEKRE